MFSSRPSLRSLRWIVRPADVTERNFRNVLIDGIGVGLVTGIGTFLPVFLARLGASSFLIGLLTSLPALAGALLAVPIGRLLERQRNVVPWYSGARVWVLWAYALFGVVPFVVPPGAVPLTIIIIWALVTIPSTIVNVTFTLVMGGVAGPQRRFSLMSMRWSTLGFTTAIAVALAGLMLDWLPFPLNYQLVFIASFVGGLMSFLFSRAIVLPDQTPPAPPPKTTEASQRPSIVQRWAWLPPAFTRFVFSAFVFRAGIAMALPLFPLYWVRQVQASDGWIGLINMANSGVLLVAYFLWARWARTYGVGRVLLLTSIGMAFYPLLTAVTPVVWPLVLLAGLAGFFAAGNDLVNFDLLLSTVPSDHQATYIGLYQTLQNTAIFALPIVGTLLADLVGLPIALALAGALRLTGAMLYVVFGLHKVGRPGAAPLT